MKKTYSNLSVAGKFLLGGVFTASAIFMQGCLRASDDATISPAGADAEQVEFRELPEQPFLSLRRTTMVTPEGDSIPMMLREHEDYFSAEDDIAIPKSQTLAKSSANITVASGSLWTGSIIPYVISINDGQQTAILAAMAEWQAKARITFIPRSNQGNYVDFVRDPNVNMSYIGMIGGRQTVKLKAGIGSSTILHEIGHTIGLFHEHQRTDRAQHVSVMAGGWQNCSGALCNSVCNAPMSTSGCPYGTNNSLFLTDICPIEGTPYGSYDKNSIMHYSKMNSCQYYNPVLNAWFDAKPGTASIANAGISISAGDIAGVTEMYVKGWRNPDHRRVSADVNDDGRKDIIGFGEYAAYVSLSNGSSFNAPSQWSGSYGYSQGWDKFTVKNVADVNADGRADIVGFGYNEVVVALSNGSSFGATSTWHNDFGYLDGWNEYTVKTLADVNGDGRADIVGFGYNDVIVSLSNGSSFGVPAAWHSNYAYNDGWNEHTVRTVADVNGDGRADIIGFGYGEVYVALSNGSSFGAPAVWHNDYAYNDGWTGPTVRTVADVNGDGRADIVGYGYNDVIVSLSNGSSFGAPANWQTNFGYLDGWNEVTVKTIADYSGDGRADIIGFGYNEVVVAASNGSGFPSITMGIPSKFVNNSNEWGF